VSADAVLRALAAAGGHTWAALAIKTTVVMLTTLVLLRLLARASASLRHLLTAATFALLLMMPLAALLVPARTYVVHTARVPGAARPAASPSGASSVTTTPTAAPRSLARGQRAVVKALPWAYTAVAALSLLALATGIVRLFRLRARAEVSVTGTRLANELARREGARDGIEVLTTAELAVPLTLGWSRPVILLPAETVAWNEEEMMRALRHEIEHVTRGDWAAQVLARVALAVYWIHPLTWVLWRRLRLEAERACDDAVVRSQGAPETYAEQLVALARRMREQGQVPALAMATRSNLGRRVESILAPGRRRAPRSPLASTCAIALVLVAAGALGPVRLAAASDGPTLEHDLKVTLEEDLDVDSDDSLDMRLLKAAERGALDEMRGLIDAGAQANAALAGDGSPLIAAARRGRVPAMELLVGAGADVNRGVEGDGSPLIAAASRGHLEAVRFLLGRGASIDAGVPGDGNALIMAAGEGHVDVVRLLLDQGAGIETVVPGDENALIHACEAGQADVVRLLLERGANVHARVAAVGPDGRREWRTPLSMARRGGHADVVRILEAAGARE
jgi:beta-lactamase regulating signal transducer with metallopeptidase domain